MDASHRRVLISRLLFSPVILLAFVVLNACGGGESGSSGTPRGAGSSTVLITMGDAASDRIAVFSTTVKSISLTDSAGNIVSVLSSPVKLEITQLTGTAQPVAAASIAQTTYTKATITLDVSTATVVDPGTHKESQQTLPAPVAVTVTFSPSLVLGSSTLLLNLDLSLARSISLDTSGNLLFNPVFTAAAGSLGATPTSPFNGGLENKFGSVTSVANTSFGLAVGSQTLTFNTNSNTQFVTSSGINGINQIAVGMLLMVDGQLQSDGSLVATRVAAVNIPSTMGALGLVRAVNSTTSQLQLLVRSAAGSSLTSTVGVGLLADFSGTTAFRVDNDGVDVSNLAFTTTFSPSTIAPGQYVEVDTSTAPVAVPPPVGTLAGLVMTATRQVTLEQQPLIGTVSNFFNGVAFFTLALPADSVFAASSGTTTVTVFIQPGTSLVNVSNLANGSTVIVRGLLFLDGGTYKMVAGRILPAP